MEKEILAIKIPKKKVQQVLEKIKQEDNFNSEYRIEREKDFIVIPIKQITKELEEFETIYLKNPKKQKKLGLTFKEILKKNNISKEILDKIPNSYDIVGDIVIINIENLEEVKNYIDKIGNALKEVNPHIKVVLNKAKEHHGEFRTQDLEWIWGENRKETIIIENGCKLKTDVEKVFYSTRLATERKRIASLVKKDEIVGVFFAGVGPFAIEIEKLASPKEIIAIELNPIGVNYLKKNIKLNKMENKIKPILGDVKKVSKDYKNYFDRIPMPLPKSSELFLDSAIYSIKNNGIIHVYSFASKNEPYKEIEKIIKQKEKNNNCILKIINKKVIKSFSPAVIQIVIDIKVIKN
jgi:tRNA (guanine37-N1)-methyltransferase